MKIIDLKKQRKEFYTASTSKPKLVDVPAFKCLMIDGAGDPNTSQEFKDAIETLFPVAYTMKFMLKKDKGLYDYPVLPLEGLWWLPKGAAFDYADKSAWLWRIFIALPDVITKAYVAEASEKTKKKKDAPAMGKLRFEEFAEGKAAQIMHIGPFNEEPATVERLHAFIDGNGFKQNGKHHEIYLSDFRSCDPKKMKTIIRYPVKKK